MTMLNDFERADRAAEQASTCDGCHRHIECCVCDREDDEEGYDDGQ